ncbi:MAG: tetratricopeptide repeat protein [Methylophaga sp.]|nr:MAG: tetratricopeptide repeat protein [Methylophaga sp.]
MFHSLFTASVSLVLGSVSTALVMLLLSPLLHADSSWQNYQQQATIFYQQGNYNDAETLLNQAIIRADKADNGLKFKASSLNLLAFVLMAKGDKKKALTSLDQALLLAEQLYAKDHPKLAMMLFNKGDFLEQSGQERQAITAYQSAWLIQSKNLKTHGDAALKTAQALTRLNNKLQYYKATIDVASTVETYQKENLASSFNEKIRQISYALAEAHMKRGQAILAQQALEQELSYEQKTLKMDDVRIAETLERLAVILDVQNKQAAAIHLRVQASKTREHQDKPSLINVMNLNELALDHQQKEQFDKAKPLYQKALTTLHQLGQDNSVEQALILGNLGSLEEDLGNKEEALKLYLQSVELHNKLQQSPQLASNIAARAAAIFYSKRQYKKAEPLFLQAFELLEVSSALKPELKVALENLVTLYDAWGKQVKKSKYLKKLRILNKVGS